MRRDSARTDAGERRASRSRGSCSAQRGRGNTRLERARRSSSPRRPRPTWRCEASGTASFPTSAAMSRTLRGAEGSGRSGRDLHAHAPRPASGSPSRMRADMEHLAKPSRSSNTRSRSTTATSVRRTSSCRCRRSLRSRRRGLSWRLPDPERKALVRRGAVPRADAGSRHGIGLAERIRGGVHLSQALAAGRMSFRRQHRRRRGDRARAARGRARVLRADVGHERVRGAWAEPGVSCSAASRTTGAAGRCAGCTTRPPLTRRRSSFAARRARSSTLLSTCARTRRPITSWFGMELSAENRLALYVPEGCAHGFLTLTDDSEVALPDLRVLGTRRRHGASAGTIRRSGSTGRATLS